MVVKSKDLHTKMEDSDSNEYLDFDLYDLDQDNVPDDFGGGEATTAESGGGGGEESDDGKAAKRNKIMSNVMLKILSTDKKDNGILSKAKKDNLRKDSAAKEAETVDFEVVDEFGNIKKDPLVEVAEEEKALLESYYESDRARKLWDQRFLVKPSVTGDREKEKKLRLIATQGVVQLFSAIEKHKNRLQKKVSETRSVMGREKVLETTGKEAFMAVLREQGRRANKKRKVKEEVKQAKTEVKGEQVKEEEEREVIPVAKKPRWSVLSDNFYKEPTLQAWDQQSDADDDD